MRYSGGVIKRTKLELMSAAYTLVKRKRDEDLSVWMEDCVRLDELSLDSYLSQSEERLLKAARRRRNQRIISRRKQEERVKDCSLSSTGNTYDRRGRWLVVNPGAGSKWETLRKRLKSLLRQRKIRHENKRNHSKKRTSEHTDNSLLCFFAETLGTAS